ncbi:hypothetical protein WP8W19C03_27420 [Aeromonas veronii]|nr:hypothetical protein WP8W19C03_27420 [Aeromonas veronii]
MSVSVITPMYNEALNIEKCYRNLREQKNIKFEWVVIDDGSTDNSVEIVTNLMSSHVEDIFNIKLIKQENAGAAAARKNGIDNCKYDVVTILDADDKLSERALELAFAKISNSVDVVCYKVNFVDADGVFLSEFCYKPKNWPVSGQQAFSECIDGWGLTGWFMIKKKTILYTYKYISNMNIDNDNAINLDELISRLNMYYAEEVDICDGLYIYYKNMNSTTNRINKNYYTVISTALELDEFIRRQSNLDWQVRSQMHLLATTWGVYSRYLKWSSKLDNRHDWLLSLNHLAKKIDFSLLLKDQLRIKNKIKLYIKMVLAIYLRVKY